MKKRKFISFFLAVVALFACSGCSLEFLSVESMLKPPAISGKSGEVQYAFQKIMSGRTVQLKTPLSGEHRSSFVLQDIDGDSLDEAIVFYTDSSVDSAVRIALMQYIDDSWVIASDIKGSGSSVYNVNFCDLDNDSIKEIIIGWSLYESKTVRIATVFKVTKGRNDRLSCSIIGNEYYNHLIFNDFNSDGKNDILIVYLDDSADVQKTFLRMFSLTEKKEFVKYAEMLLDSSAASVYDMRCDTAKKGGKSFKRLFVSCLKTDSTMFTELVYWDPDSLSLSRVFDDPSFSALTAANVTCRDIDFDGYIEVPVIDKISGLPDDLSVTTDEKTYTFMLLRWLNCIGDKSKREIVSFYNPVDSYILLFPWKDDVTVKYDRSTATTKFCSWSSFNSSVGDELFSIHCVELDDLSGVSDKEQVLYKTSTHAFYFTISRYGESMGVSANSLISSFAIIE